MVERPLVDGFLLGLPKCGTTWLAGVLSQNQSISFSSPKEPNILASHRGTFGRDESEPDLQKYERSFSGGGFRIDGSVHAFSCPLAPRRVFEINPEARFIICLREPVERAFSHWKMVRDDMADRIHGADWSAFGAAWSDERLKGDSIWSDSMERWLNFFELERFLFVDSRDLRNSPELVLRDIDSHLGIDEYEYDLERGGKSNESRNRRAVTGVGVAFKRVVRFIPESTRNILSMPLQKRSINIYDLPIISREGEASQLGSEHYNTCATEVISDLERFEVVSGFSTSHWVEGIRRKCSLK